MSPFELCSFCSGHVFSYNFAYFLLLKRVKCPPFLVFTTKTTQPQGFSVNDALTSKNAAFLTSFPRQTQSSSKFLSWGIMRVLLANQNRVNILNEEILLSQSHLRKRIRKCRVERKDRIYYLGVLLDKTVFSRLCTQSSRNNGIIAKLRRYLTLSLSSRNNFIILSFFLTYLILF